MTFIEMLDVERALLDEIADPRMKRDDVALAYAFGLRQHAEVDWRKVNEAIIDRWSPSGLEYVKGKAWKRLEEAS